MRSSTIFSLSSAKLKNKVHIHELHVIRLHLLQCFSDDVQLGTNHPFCNSATPLCLSSNWIFHIRTSEGIYFLRTICLSLISYVICLAHHVLLKSFFNFSTEAWKIFLFSRLSYLEAIRFFWFGGVFLKYVLSCRNTWYRLPFVCFMYWSEVFTCSSIISCNFSMAV